MENVDVCFFESFSTNSLEVSRDMYPKQTDLYLLALMIIVVARHLYVLGSTYFFYEAILVAIAAGLRFKSKVALIVSWFYTIILAVAALRWGLDMIVEGAKTENNIMGYFGWAHVPLSVCVGIIATYFLFNKELANFIGPVPKTSNKSNQQGPSAGTR
ncbi:MAG: hypothetical protein ACRBCS_00010 [Cellvibrionaceae bacterium]